MKKEDTMERDDYGLTLAKQAGRLQGRLELLVQEVERFLSGNQTGLSREWLEQDLKRSKDLLGEIERAERRGL